MHDIDEKDETLNSLVQQNAKDYYINKRIYELALESFVVSSKKQFDVEIDAEQNQKLLKDKIVNKIAKKLAGRKKRWSWI